MSGYRRGYSWEQIQYLQAPSGGWNPDVPPHEMLDTQAPFLDNLLPRPGKVVMRGSVKLIADLTANAPLNVMGAVGTGSGALITQRATNAFDPWQVPIVGQVGSTSQASTTVLRVTTGGAITTITVTRDQAPGFRWINFDGLLYGISADSASTAVHDTNNTYSLPPLNLLTVPDSSSSAPTVLAGSPKGALDLTGHQSRIWLLGGVDTPGAGTTHSSVDLFFTNPIASGGGGSAADWQDPVTGLTNQIVLDRDVHDPGVGIAKTLDGLLVFRRHSVWILRGATTASFTARMVSSEAGCVDARSIVESDRGVYFLSDKGLMLTNGVRVQNVSGAVRYTLEQAIVAARNGSQSMGETAFQCALLSDGSILVSVIAAPTSSQTSTPIWCGCYDPSTGAWWRLTSPLWTPDSGPQGVNLTPNLYPGILVSYKPHQRVLSIGDHFVTMLEDYHSFNSGITGPRAGAAGWYDDSNDAAAFATRYYGIPAQWITRAVPLGTGGRKRAQAKRYFIDYVSQAHTDTSGWAIQPIDTDYSSIGPAAVAPGMVNALVPPSSSLLASGSTYGVSNTLQRVNVDFENELIDMAYRITWQAAGPAPNVAALPQSAMAEIHGIGTEFQPTSDLR